MPQNILKVRESSLWWKERRLHREYECDLDDYANNETYLFKEITLCEGFRLFTGCNFYSGNKVYVVRGDYAM